MENFEQRLKEDAGEINVQVSSQLDERIRASLESVTPAVPPGQEPRPRHAWFWWASSLTGAAAAAVVLAVMNFNGAEPKEPPAVVSVPALAVPNLDVRPAMAPLETELENLKGDLERAEALLRGDLDRILGETPPASE